MTDQETQTTRGAGAGKSAGGEEGTTQQIASCILQFLDDELKNPTLCHPDKKDSLEVAIQCLEAAFGMSVNDSNFFKPKVGLVDLLRQSESRSTATDEYSSSTSTQTSTAGTASRGPGLPFAGLSCVSMGEPYVKPPEASEENKALANEAKNKGNDAMKDLKLTEAVELYTKGIELDGNNPTIFCNRAAAYIKMEDFEKAIRDCQIAAQLQSNYARAYGRMGIAYATQGKHVDALLCFNKALEHDPDNETYQRNIRISTDMVMQDLPSSHDQFTSSPNVSSSLLANFGPILSQIRNQIAQVPEMQETITRVASLLASGLAQRGDPDNAGDGDSLSDLSRLGRAFVEMLSNQDENESASASTRPAENVSTENKDQEKNQPTIATTTDSGMEAGDAPNTDIEKSATTTKDESL